MRPESFKYFGGRDHDLDANASITDITGHKACASLTNAFWRDEFDKAATEGTSWSIHQSDLDERSKSKVQ
jgi:hypothetical protein